MVAPSLDENVGTPTGPVSRSASFFFFQSCASCFVDLFRISEPLWVLIAALLKSGVQKIAVVPLIPPPFLSPFPSMCQLPHVQCHPEAPHGLRPEVLHDRCDLQHSRLYFSCSFLHCTMWCSLSKNVPVKVYQKKYFCNLLIKIFNLVPKFLVDSYRIIFTKWAPHSALVHKWQIFI